MIDWTPLMRPQPPWLLWFVGDDAAVIWRAPLPPRTVIRRSRGSAMRTREELFSELATSLSFPDYFGRNWDALEDLLTDYAWMPASGYVLIISEANELLAAEPASELQLLLHIMRDVADEWAQPEVLPDGVERPPTPFHLVLQVSASRAEEAFARIKAASVAAHFGVLAAASASESSEEG